MVAFLHLIEDDSRCVEVLVSPRCWSRGIIPLETKQPLCLFVAVRPSCESVCVQAEHRRRYHLGGAEHDRSLVSQTLLLFAFMDDRGRKAIDV